MKRLLREPMLHFFLLEAALFAVFNVVSQRTDVEPDHIVVTPGQWQGPVESGYGAHLVLVTERTPGHLPSLADVGDAVRREWANARRLEANESFFQSLLKRYTVTIEQPKPKDGDKKVAVAK